MPFYNQRILAARFPDECYYFGAKGAMEFDWRADHIDDDWRNHGFCDWLLITSTDCFCGVPVSREFGRFALPSTSVLPEKAQTELMFFALGWWPFRDRPGPTLLNGGQCVIPGMLTSGEYSVAAEQQLLRERWRHILEYPTKDRTWIDCDRGGAWMRREIYGQASEHIIQRIDHFQHYEAESGVWAPREMRNIHFDAHAATPELRNRKTINARIKIVELQLNDEVNDDLFEFQAWPAGALEVVAGGGYQQATPGGHDHMDQFVDWAQRTQRLRPYKPQESGGAARDYVAIAVASTILLILSLAPRKRRLAPEKASV